MQRRRDAKRSRRKMSSLKPREEEKAETKGTLTPEVKPPIELIKPIVRKEIHKEVDFAHVPHA